MLTAGAVVWPDVLTLHLCIGTTEEFSHAELAPGLISCNLPLLMEKCGVCLQWAMRCPWQEIPGCWGRCFVVMVHSPPVMEFPGGGAPLRDAGHSAWYSDLAAGNAAWQALGPGWRFLSWWCPGALSTQSVRCAALQMANLAVPPGVLPCSTGCSNTYTVFVPGECGLAVSSGCINNSV